MKNLRALVSVVIVTAILFTGTAIYAKIVTERSAEKVPVLMYHHILKESEIKALGTDFDKSCTISVEKFEEQMEYLHNNKYTTLTMKQFEDFVIKSKNVPERSVVITFDDGYKSNYIYAYPILKKYNLKATIFIIGDKIQPETVPFNTKAIQFLSKQEIEKGKDVFEYGSHTFGMHNKKNGDAALVTETQENIEADLLKIKKLQNTNCIAYPYGKYNDTTLKAVKNTKYTLGFTTRGGYICKFDNPLTLKRCGIGSVPRYMFVDIVSCKNNFKSAH